MRVKVNASDPLVYTIYIHMKNRLQIITWPLICAYFKFARLVNLFSLINLYSSSSLLFEQTDEPKLNSGCWEDPLPLSHATKAAGQLHTIGSRRSEPFSSVRGTSSNSSAGKFGISLHLNYPFAASNGFHQRQNRRRLEHTPYTRNASVEDSWCSERTSEHDLSSDGEDEDKKSISSLTSISLRNSNLRSTLNKAKQHLSFDKWRGNHNNASGNNTNNTNANSMIMPSQQSDTLSLGESTPGGRLSRWFSIRRGSTHQYDIGGKDGRDSRASSCDIEDKAKQVPATVNGHKMPLLPEVNDDIHLDCISSKLTFFFVLAE